MDRSNCLVTLPSSATSEAVATRRILIVDADAGARRCLTAALQGSGVNVVRAVKDAAEALAALREQPSFNIVVCTLPQAAARGCPLIARLRAEGERVPVLAIASQWDIESLAAALEAGADDYLQKPFDLNELRRSISMLCSRSFERMQRADKQGLYYDAKVISAESEGSSMLELTASTLSAQIDGFERFVERLAHPLLPPTELMYLKMAMEELVQNAKEWGNGFDPQKKIRMELRLTQERIELRVEDEGAGFDPSAVPDPSLDPRAHIRQRIASGKRMGGWGLFIARKRMDELTFNAAGNAVSIAKVLSRAATPDVPDVPAAPDAERRGKRRDTRRLSVGEIWIKS
ncbi:MAG TPA: ATP-binding protein [Planctomycetota bacterium]|nr:ATP-binding protein [Planctomycetota bacterium]